MPATGGQEQYLQHMVERGTWTPQADFRHDYGLSASPAETVVDFDNPWQVAEQLRLTDPTINSYECLLDETGLQALALESARRIVERRRTLLGDRRSDAAATAATTTPATEKTIVVAMVTRNGKTFGRACRPYTPQRRFG